MAKKSAKAAKATVKKAKANGHAKFSPDAKITLLVKDNPKRKSSKEFKRYAKYKTGMTVAEAYEAGMNAGNLTRDVERKCIRVGG